MREKIAAITTNLYRPGQIVLKGGDELFQNKYVCSFYNYILNSWVPPHKKIALYFGCSWHKPFSRSFIHLKAIKMLEKYELDKMVQQFIISEPLIICPRELENVFPAANYDFPPKRLGERGRKIFVERLRSFIKKYGSNYDFHVGFMPNHHREIFDEASKGIIKPLYIPYNVFQLPNLLELLKRLNKKIGGETHCY